MTRPGKQTRRLLLIGFGGMLVLLAFTGLNALSVLKRIEDRNERIREDYVNRDRILEQLRSDIYLSGTYVRDLLLEPDPRLADVHRRELQDAKSRIEANIAAYKKVLRAEERTPFDNLAKETEGYFDSFPPALEWNAAQRQSLGYSFMKNSLLPRRMTVIRLADEIVTVNQSQMEAGSKQIATLFADFRRSSIVFLTLAFVCATLLAVESIHRILGLERVSAQRLEEVEQARAASRELSARLINVQESERRALSRDLHDEVGQSLSALLLGIGNVAAALPPDSNPAIKDQLYDLRRLAERTVAVVRDMSLLLRPSMLDDLGLIPALQWQAREIFRTKNLHVLVDAEFVPEDLSDEQKTCIYRIVQEALNNAARHASARTVRVSLKRAADNLDLTIEDDGQGFMPEREKGLGLLGMEERVRHLGGALHIDSLPGRGTSIHVELPLLQTAAAHVV